jgi:hypothetical protein
MGAAMRATPGHFIEYAPIVEAVRLYDEDLRADWLFRVPWLFKSMNLSFVVILAVSSPLWMLMLAYAPFAHLEMAGITPLFFPTASNATSLADERPLLAGWIRASLGMSGVWSSCVVLNSVFLSFFASPAMVRVLFKAHSGRLAAIVVTTFGYTAAAATMLPSVHHVLWLAARAAILMMFTFVDAFFTTFRLRFEPERFRVLFGGSAGAGNDGTKDSNSKRNGWVTVGVIWVGCSTFLVVDFFRHQVVQFASAEVVVLEMFGVTNPVTHRRFAITSHEVCDACYFTSVLLIAQSIVVFIKSHAGDQSTLLKTRFRVLLRQ